MKRFIQKNWKYFLVLIFIFISVLVYKYNIKAEENFDNQIKISNAIMTKIETGNTDFSNNDGLTYDENGNITDFIPGEDSSIDNRIVRSFDTISYYFDVSIKGKDNDNNYEDRSVFINVILNDEESKYISFYKDEVPNEKSHTFEFNNINSYDSAIIKITLYVVNAENNKEIAPKFVINESTNQDDGIVLGKISDEVYNYEFVNDNYLNESSISEFNNYMPTYTSSIKKELKLIPLESLNESEKAIYDNKKGRYLTSLLQLIIEGENENNYKGVYVDKNEISFSLNFETDGEESVIFDKSFVRNYTLDTFNDISSFTSIYPLSLNNSNELNSTRYPGKITAEKIDDKYEFKITDYDITYSSPVKASDGSNLNLNKNYIGTYMVSAFSERSENDGRNDISVKFNYEGATKDITIVGNNPYFMDNDSELISEFYDESGMLPLKGNSPHGTSSASKGSTVTYKTIFNYNDISNTNGFKEYIKIDERAFRVLPISEENDIKIENNCETDECKEIFNNLEISYISGDFKNENYEAINYNELDKKISNENKDIILESCNNVNNNLNNYSINQIMNLYGSPCIKAKDYTENIFTSIEEAKDKENNEIPISKIIIQSKKGVTLKGNIKLSVTIKLRVRNVLDNTKTYQVVSNITSSDYDKTLNYFYPRITNLNNSITNKDNYLNTVYLGQNIERIGSGMHGDSLKITDFKINSSMHIKNVNQDGSEKNNYNVKDNESIVFCVSTNIEDYGSEVSSDDAWFIKNLNVLISLPDTLDYIEDKSLGLPEKIDGNIYTYLVPFTKPNMKIKDVCIKTKLNTNVKKDSISEEVTVNSITSAVNINNQKDTSYFENLTSNYTIYATGTNLLIPTIEYEGSSSLVDKNEEFSYKLNVYNNTDTDITEYIIKDILPQTNDESGSKFEGKYKVKLSFNNISDSFSNSKVYCLTTNSLGISKNLFDDAGYDECDLITNFKEVSSIKITNIKINKDSYMDQLVLTIKPENNNYDNKYVNSFIGGSNNIEPSSSNLIDTKVINRSISGKVFYDINEDGIRNDKEGGIKDLPVTLYLLENNELKKVTETTTDENGNYRFEKIDNGHYKIQISYDKEKYDVTLRYANENRNIDSDAYKIKEGIAEISNKKGPNEEEGISLTNDIIEVNNMDLGLIPITSLGFEMKKYITQIDLNYNDMVTTNYYNDSKVLLNLRNSLNATAKIYYGISITNNSLKSGYVKLVEENIPEGLLFDSLDEYNKDWFMVNGKVQSDSLKNVVINPGETKYLKIVLNMPKKEEATTFINTVSILEIEEYEKAELSKEYNVEYDRYVVGEKINYAGYKWHVINKVDNENDQTLTLFMDSNQLTKKELTTTDKYKWSTSTINNYLNNEWSNESSINLSILEDNSICDDASGLKNISYGGMLESSNMCTSNIYAKSKVRLLTESEFTYLKSLNLTDMSFIYGNYWLINASDELPVYDDYGKQTNSSIMKNAKYVNNDLTLITNADVKKDIRPVIVISSKNILGD